MGLPPGETYERWIVAYEKDPEKYKMRAERHRKRVEERSSNYKNGNLDEEIRNIRLETAHIYNNRCFICRRNVGNGKRFLYHHLWYGDGDKKYSNFKNDRLGYAEYIRDRIRKNPKQFKLLCVGCHQSITLRGKWSKDKLERFVQVVLETRGDTSLYAKAYKLFELPSGGMSRKCFEAFSNIRGDYVTHYELRRKHHLRYVVWNPYTDHLRPELL